MKKIIVFLLLMISVFIIVFLNGYFSKRTEMYMETKGVLYSERYIKEALKNDVIKKIDLNSLYLIDKNEEGIVTQVIINTYQINDILSTMNDSLDKQINLLKKEELHLPIGTIISESLFSNLGPNIKIKIYPIGRYTCDIISDIKEYGINNSIFEISLKVNLMIETIIPLKKSKKEVECTIPIVLQVLQGSVPRYYYNTKDIVPDVYESKDF